jgi:hypothetical protein
VNGAVEDAVASLAGGVGTSAADDATDTFDASGHTGAARGPLRTWRGGCHCGAVRFEVDADIGGSDTVVSCNCSVCTMKGILHLIVPPARFRLLAGGDALSTYTFGTHTARHTFCRTCGIHPFYTPRSHPDAVDVNVRCLAGVDLEALTVTPFDGRRWEEARATLPDV